MGALAVAHLDATQLIARRQAERVQRAWRGLDPGDLRGSFAVVAPLLVAAITAGQLDAAALATPYVAAVLADTDGEPDAVVMPVNFAGLASSGIPLAALADLLLIGTLSDIAAGMSTQDALTRGMNRAVLYAANEITDASRTATQAQMITDRRVAGYERVVHLPACDRCIVLAGRLYRYATAFRRHPRCDCTMLPVTRQQWQESNVDNHPRALFDAMTPAQQDEKFGAGNASAIRAGADLSQVVNARRGTLLVAGRWTTTAGTTVRGIAGLRMAQLATTPGGRYRRSQLTRPTAGQLIADLAGSSRDELISALRRYGYAL